MTFKKFILFLYFIISTGLTQTLLQDLILKNNLYYKHNNVKPFTGKVVQKYENGNKYIKGYIKKGLPEKSWKYWHGNGNVKEKGDYYKGFKSGHWKEWSDTGDLIKINFFMPGNWEFRNIDGQRIKYSDLRGKVVFLNVWATWCGPCVAEMPFIQKLINEFENEDIEFLLVTKENIKQVIKFKKNNLSSLPLYGEVKNIPPVLKVFAFPTTFIMDKNGKIVIHEIGAKYWSSPEYIELIAALLKSPKHTGEIIYN